MCEFIAFQSNWYLLRYRTFDILNSIGIGDHIICWEECRLAGPVVYLSRVKYKTQLELLCLDPFRE
jgi:hypothetical protein